jgi:hypothetical protein
LAVTDVTASALADALRDRYRLEHELGRGGMATVYLARDLKHDRQVALKVLRAELAQALGPERFLREIRLAAQLQHPHILPLHDSGEAAGLLWYTTPYVRGESLRDQLRRDVQLPVDSAVALARQVALALDYAHREGVIHRDLKPENILLSEGQALVADFGVAKALSAAGEGQLTETGMAVGTPVYMSPEQASGGQIDGRSDTYALGCVLYEMLAGEPPYTGPTAQAVVAKRFTDPVPSIRRLREDIPETVDRAIRTALAKTPADRFASAAEFASALGAPNAAVPDLPTLSARERQRRVSRMVIPGALLALVTLVVVLLHRSRPPLLAPNDRVVMVLPFRVAGADPRLAYLREGMVDLLAAKLTGDGGPRAVDPRSVLSAWRRAGGSAQDDVSPETAMQIAQRLGAGRMIVGSVVGAPDGAVFTASMLKTRATSAAPPITLEGPLDSLSGLVDRLTARLLAGEAGEAEKLADLTSTSLPALRAYLEGRAAYRQGRYLEAVQQFGQALELDSTFALAGIGLESAAWYTPRDRDIKRGLALAWANKDRLSKRDHLFLVASAGPRFPTVSSSLEHFHAWERLLEVAPDQPEAHFGLADLLFHHGPTFEYDESHVRAARGFGRALELDSTFAAPLGHLIDLAATAHDTARLRSLLQVYLLRNPDADDAMYMRWRVANAIGDTIEQGVIRSRFSQLAEQQLANIAQMAEYDGVGVEDVRHVFEILRQRAETSEERYGALSLAMITALNEGRPAFADGAARALRASDGGDLPNGSLYMRILSGLYWGGDSGSAAAAATLLGVPARGAGLRSASVTPSDLLDLCIAQLWRTAGQDGAHVDEVVSRVSAGSGSLDFAYREQLCARLLDVSSSPANDSEALTRKLERLDSLILQRGVGGAFQAALIHASNLELSRRWAAGGDLARALRTLRRRAYFFWDLIFFSAALREEGRLAALAGDRDAAIRAYQHYLALRFDPDPSQRADVEQARAELANLVGETPR